MKKSELKSIIRECIEEIMIDEQELDEGPFGLTYDKNKRKVRKQTDAEKFRAKVNKEKKASKKVVDAARKAKREKYIEKIGKAEAGYSDEEHRKYDYRENHY